MQYLNLVYLAERKGEALSGQRYAPRTGPPVVDALAEQCGDQPDDDSPFFTDGPYVETKEYPGAGRGV